MAIPWFSPTFACQIQGCGVNNGVKHDHVARDMNHNGALSLSPSEITNLDSLAAKFKEPCNELSRYLVGRFSEATRQLLSAYTLGEPDSQALKSALAQELTIVIDGKSIFDADRFAGITLSKNTQKFVGQKLEGQSLVCFNRMLVVDAYLSPVTKRPSPRPKQRTVRVGIGLYRVVGVHGIYGKKKIQGRTRVTALQTDDPKEAREKYEEWVLWLRKSLKMACAEKGTLASFVEPYLASRAPEVARNKLKPSTIVGLRKRFHDLGQHWKEFHTLPISDLFPETITDLQNHLLTKARNLRTGQPLKLGTYNSFISPLAHLLDYLAKEGKLPRERYYALKERIKLADVPSRKVEIPTPEQLCMMREYLYRVRWGRGQGECGPKFDVYMLTGIRNATMSAMQVNHINFAKRTIKFTKLKGRAGEIDEKEIPVLDEVLEVLQRHIKARGLQSDDLVFQTKSSNKAFRSAAKHAGIETWFQHACRKWFATQALAQTNDAMSVADMLCHRDGGLSLFKAYRQSFAAHLEGTVRTLKLLPGATPDNSLGAAKARAEHALIKFVGLEKEKAAALLDHILWLESEVDLGHYDVVSRLPGLRRSTPPLYSPGLKPLFRRPSPALLKKNLRHLLRKKGVYYSDVAAATGFAKSTIAQAFTYGSAQATLMPVFSNYFGVSVEHLLTVDLERAEQSQSKEAAPADMNPPSPTENDPQPTPRPELPMQQDQDAEPSGAVIVRNLRSLMFEQNLTGPKLARLSGICQQHIYQYVKEQRPLDSPALARIAQALHVDEAEITNPGRANIMVNPDRVIVNLKAILAHHGCSNGTYQHRLVMGGDTITDLLKHGNISSERAHRIARAEKISVRQLVSQDVSHLFVPKLTVDPAVLSRNLHSLCWETGLTPNQLAIKCGIADKVAYRYFNAGSKRPSHKVLTKIATAMGFDLAELVNPARPYLEVTHHFRNNIHHLVHQSGRSAATVSKWCGLNAEALPALLEGAKPTSNQVTRIAQQFNLSLADLLMKDLVKNGPPCPESQVSADRPAREDRSEMTQMPAMAAAQRTRSPLDAVL